MKNSDIRKIILQFNGQTLNTALDIKLEEDFTNYSSKQYSITFGGMTEEYILIRDTIKQKDTNLLDIYIVDTASGVPNPKTIHWSRNYVAYAQNLETRGDSSGGFYWRLFGLDVFGSLETSDIAISAFVNPPVNLISVFGGIMEELNYTKVPTFNTNFVGNTTINSFSNSYTTSPTATNNRKSGKDFFALDTGVTKDDITFSANSNFPRPENQATIKAKNFMLNLLKMKNLYLVSNGVDTLTITKAGINTNIIGNDILNYSNASNINLNDSNGYFTSQSTISSFSKKAIGGYHGIPCYATTMVGKITVDSIIDNGLNNTEAGVFVAGVSIDSTAVPHNQSIEYITGIPTTNSSLTGLATIVANTRRSFKNTINYTIDGTFFTKLGNIYQTNRFIQIEDEIHGYSGNMLIAGVSFSYNAKNGSSTEISVAPSGSYTSLNPADYVKLINKNKPSQTKQNP